MAIVLSSLQSAIQAYVFDAVGIAFTGAAIYVGIFHGTSGTDFVVFATLAGSYLGYKGGQTTASSSAAAAARVAKE